MLDTSTRRAFLRHSVFAAAVAAGAFANSQTATAADAAPERKFKLSLNPGMLGIRANLKDCLALASQFGFEAIEPMAGELSKMSDEAIASFNDEMKAKKIVWGSTAMPNSMNRPDEAFNGWLARLPETAVALRKAGATRIGTWLTPGDNQMTYVENFRRQAKHLAETAKVFEDNGIALGLEYLGPKTMRARMKYPFAHTMREMRELIAESGAKNVGLMLDSWHWFNSSETPADIKALTNKDVVFVHINDAPAGIPLDQQVDNHRALPATTGVIDIGGFLGALIAIGYDGPAACEPFDTSLGRMPREQACKLAVDAFHNAMSKVKA